MRLIGVALTVALLGPLQLGTQIILLGRVFSDLAWQVFPS